MKPTVSTRRQGWPKGNRTERVVGSRVAKSWFSANAPPAVMALSSVDLPALV